MEKDYYKILGVEKTASDEEIKSAYRKLAGYYHPDVSTDPNATEKMALINEAYSVLKDKDKRSQYDNMNTYNSYNQTYNPYGQEYTSANANPWNRAYNFNFSFKNRKSILGHLFKFILIILVIRLVSLLLSGGIFSSDYELNYSLKENNEVYVSYVTESLFSNYDEIVIPESYEYIRRTYKVTAIGEKAFFYNDNIETLTIYSSIEEIGDYAFYGCSNLETINFYGTEEEFNKITVGVGNEYFLNAEVIFK